jgi:hypothetical protein
MTDTPDIVERLRAVAAAEAEEEDAAFAAMDALHAAADEIERLRDLVLKYEAVAATTFGTLEKRPEPDEPFSVTHNVPGNAPT